MNALEELQNKPREKRTPLEQCIVDATTFEEAEHDGEIELMEQAAKDLVMMDAQVNSLTVVNDELHKKLNAISEALGKAKSIFDAAYAPEDLRLAEKHINNALAKLYDKRHWEND